jgi:hypothetical protein
MNEKTYFSPSLILDGVKWTIHIWSDDRTVNGQREVRKFCHTIHIWSDDRSYLVGRYVSGRTIGKVDDDKSA